jgi:glycosyltransferase involved in cell wall biosynthesis
LTWNEIDGCKVDVPRIPREAFDEIYAIDGGSMDGTIEYLTETGIRVIKQDFPTYNGAYRSAFNHCTTDVLVFFHPKGSIDPATLLQFRPLFEAGADLVVASRLIKGAVNEEDSRLFRPRKWFVATVATIAAVLWNRSGPMVWDVLHGCRGMRRSAFDAIAPLPRGVSIDLEMVARAYRLGLKAVEFPVTELPRPSGETHFKAWPTGKALLKYLWAELFRPARGQGRERAVPAELPAAPDKPAS